MIIIVAKVKHGSAAPADLADSRQLNGRPIDQPAR
jgi:hypothetical protein